MKKEKGFSLLEVELALMITIVIIGVFLSSLILGTTTTNMAKGITEASFLAKTKMEEAEARFGDPFFSLKGNFSPPNQGYRFRITEKKMRRTGLSDPVYLILVKVKAPPEMGGQTADGIGVVEEPSQEVGWK
jgi:type II secretory pathway pseudopilin PulG